MGPIAEWLARIEFKIDLLLKALVGSTAFKTPMEFSTEPCPVCREPVLYQLHHQYGFVIRRCGCKTGKVPSTIPLVPLGDTNGSKERRNEGSDSGSEDGTWGETGDTYTGRVRR
jgi:hypothetical protein